jgi:hypothetical protein
MFTTTTHSFRKYLALAATVALVAACADEAPFSPELQSWTGEHALLASAEQTLVAGAEARAAIATIRRATARYHDLDTAIAEGFVLLHPCEERPGEGPVGIVYVHFDRLMDGVIDPASPDALVYEPSSNGRPKLVGAEFAIPFALWSEPEPPQFLGAEFQPEEEFGVWGLHIWAWRHNPEGMFAEANPKVSCSAD